MQLIVPKSAKGERLDVFLSKNLPHISRSLINKYIKTNSITSSNTILKPANKLKGDEIILIAIKENHKANIEPMDVKLDILYSDEHLAVINKPKGLVVHPGPSVKAPTLCHALLYHFPNMYIGDGKRPGLVHRLDKDTEGLMVVAKTQNAHMALSKAFKDKEVVKIYRALVLGEIKKDEFELITGHMRNPYNRLRFYTKIAAPKTFSPHVRLAHTKFKVMKRFHGLSLVKAVLHTGRTHQIRAHLADFGHPLLGDKLYGFSQNLLKDLPEDLLRLVLELKGQALCSEILEFAHPISQAKMSFSLKLTSFWQAFS